MDERVLLELLTSLVGRYLIRSSSQQRVPADLASDIANAAWDGLILLLRQTLVTENVVTLPDLGIFERIGDGWSFSPAAGLTEAASLRVPPEAGQAEIAAMLVIHVAAAERLLDNLSRDIRVN